jgi:hypothetical protein
VLVRVHSECLTGDVLGSLRCDRGTQLTQSMRLIADEGRGIVVYLRGHEGRGIGLGHKLRAYALQEAGRDTIDANRDLGLPDDSRQYGAGAAIIAALGARRIRVITNNPAKYGGLQASTSRSRGASGSRRLSPRRTFATCAPSGTGWATTSGSTSALPGAERRGTPRRSPLAGRATRRPASDLGFPD